ncbi:1-deoxy-D-xylulose-5-phosphate synthase [bacterium]|nr:1-deoxy-D-xylulose-5-phosphate synthase [bacterium]
MASITMRDAFFNKLYEIAKNDRNVIVVSADMGAPSLDKFRRDLPSQFINVGIAEQNMVTVATGLALTGKNVYTYAIMPFASLRCYEFIKVDFSLMNIGVTTIGVGSGFGYPDSGPTHHSTEDISALRALPNMTILNSSSNRMVEKFTEISYNMSTPCYIRLDRGLVPEVYDKSENFSNGLAMLKTGKDLYIIATGNMVDQAFKVVKKLSEHSIDAGIIDLYRIKPINTKLLIKYIKNAHRIVTLEEHFLAGGMGSAVVENLTDNGISIPIKRIGVPDKYYYAYGNRDDINLECGLDTETVAKIILKWVKKI